MERGSDDGRVLAEGSGLEKNEHFGEDKDNASSQGGDDDDDGDIIAEDITSADAISSRPWNKEEDEALKKGVNSKKGSWKEVAEIVGGGRTVADCIQRWNKALRPSIIKGYWTPEEDAALLSLMTNNFSSWKEVSKQIVGRSTKQCRERWSEYLDPSLDHGPFTPEEDAIITREQAVLGNKWKAIAERLGGRRTATSVKVRWNSISRRAKNSWALYQNPASGMMFPPGGIPMYPPPTAYAHARHMSMPMQRPPDAMGVGNPMSVVNTNQGYMQPRRDFPFEGPPPMYMQWGGGGSSGGPPWYSYPTNEPQSSESFGFMNHGRDVKPSRQQAFAMQQQQHQQQQHQQQQHQHFHHQQQHSVPQGAPLQSSSLNQGGMSVGNIPSYFISQSWEMGMRPDQQEYVPQTQHVDPQYFQYQNSPDSARLRPPPMSFNPSGDFANRVVNQSSFGSQDSRIGSPHPPPLPSSLTQQLQMQQHQLHSALPPARSPAYPLTQGASLSTELLRPHSHARSDDIDADPGDSFMSNDDVEGL
mmetsp:Transcript_35965/g.36649  ORF Transcript_35965/g.36649 Transcript_35965/m.36649 type:complete len:530 (+) Transcript_35965:156-1745(+)|eukprot:CAMPEP_0182428344 /NCGR_PEP_ID=MMETSP1167-20130531/22490_1 /TAXON_ID=2988 /ORGANISM="Mallomonas Sp, Strain CCMP3275" /LENGTH=529 /DNA_ID=CAMNT_0024611187 /DNA_START=155 /DNA_END=1744 /DNA_ORIENTATION=+